MNTRIRKVRRELDLTQEEFGARIDLKQNSITLIENGHRNISDYNLRRLCHEYNVNEHWLRTGEGEMFNPDASDEIEALVKKYDLSYADQILIEKFVNSRKEFRDAIANLYIETAKACLESGLVNPTSSYSETHRELTEHEREDLSAAVADAERLYEKNCLSAPAEDSTASSTIGEDTTNERKEA